MSNSLKSVEHVVIQIIADTLKADIEVIKADTDLINELQADSLDALEIIMLIQRTFDIEVDDNQISQLRTPNQIINYVLQLQETQQQVILAD
ncbi:MAG: acyl carrier protein [Acidobacteriota bacterium]